ncbi:MAG TPA: hypothetical protein VFN03_07275 [Trueperaceae bacterium]|nr:hypothetical protein [Trueperaceae bacterium]
MPQLESLALELLEYKAHEFRSSRSVRGGTKSMWDLVSLLSRDRERLSTDERRRFDDVTQSLQSFGDSPVGSAVATPELANMFLGDDSSLQLASGEQTKAPYDTPEEREEHAVLQRLARRVWWDDLDEYVQQVATSWRSQRDRYAARVIYATLQNLQRNSVRTTFARDASLRGFRVEMPIPNLGDPLVSLSDLDSLSEIARDLVNVIMTLGREGSPYPTLAVPEASALSYVRQAAMAVASDPYAGRTSAIDARLPSSKQLRLAIQELTKERLPEDERAMQRRELERRLEEVTAMERSEMQSFQRDTATLQEIVHAFFERLVDYLPTSVGGRASGPQLEGGVLFGINPALRTERVAPGATAITVRLVGPVRLSLHGHDFAFSGIASSRALFVDGKEIGLDGSQITQLGHDRLGVFREGEYVHLRLRDEGRSLAVRLAEALVVLHVLTSPHRQDLLTIAKVIANSVRGEPQELILQALTRATSLVARAPDQAQALDGLLRGAARATGVDLSNAVISGLVSKIVQAMNTDPADLTGVLERVGADQHEFHPLTGEPITVDVAGQKITVRQYRGRTKEAQESLVAMLPGQVLGSFTDYLLAPLGSGTLLFVRGANDIGVLYLSRAKLETAAD